jgi:hypothetical protein
VPGVRCAREAVRDLAHGAGATVSDAVDRAVRRLRIVLPRNGPAVCGKSSARAAPSFGRHGQTEAAKPNFLAGEDKTNLKTLGTRDKVRHHRTCRTQFGHS